MSTALSIPADPLDQEAPRTRTPSPSTLAMVAAMVLLTLALAWWWRWTADDAFINFRAVRNILDGEGPVFNAGQRVEVGTSPLWLWLLAASAFVLPFDVAWIAVVLGAVASATGVALACLGAVRLHGSHRTAAPVGLFLPVGVLVFLALPATWAFLTSGLETGLSFAWLGAVWLGTARVATAPVPTRPVLLLVLLGLAPLVRPDLALVGGVLGLWLLLAVPSTWSRRIRDIAVAAAVPVAYEVFRMGWFGLLVPNTAVAKESSRQLWSRGWGYLADLVAPYDLYVPAALCAALLLLTGWRVRWPGRAASLVAVTVLAGVLQALFVIRVGGDFMHGRLLLPALFQLLCPVAMLPVVVRGTRSALSGRLSVVLVAGVVAWAGVCAATLRIDYADALGPRGIADERGFYVSDSGMSNPVTVDDHGYGRPSAWGRQVGQTADAGDDLVFAQNSFANVGPIPVLVPLGRGDDTYFLVYQAGYLGYASPADVRVLDFFGLSDPIGAHLEPGPPGRPGHEKVLPLTWFWAQRGVGLPEVQSPDPAVGQVASTGVAAARAALGCGELAGLVAATEEPMSWGRFWENVTGAVDRTTLRIPADPREARDQFC